MRFNVVAAAAGMAVACSQPFEPALIARVSVSGDGQSARVLSTLPTSIVVDVRDQQGRAMPDVAITASSTAPNAVIVSASTKTGSTGRMTFLWKLGSTVGRQSLDLRWSGGSTTISATGIAATPTRIVLSSATTSMLVDDTAAVSALVTDQLGDAMAVPVEWAVQGAGQLVSDGMMRAVAAGWASVSARIGTLQSNTVTITARAPRITRINLQPGSLSLNAQHLTDRMTATAYDERGRLSANAPTWSTNESRIAMVGADGTVTAVATGVTTISATLDGVRTSATVSVDWPRVTDLAALDFHVQNDLPDPLDSILDAVKVYSAYSNVGTVDFGTTSSQLRTTVYASRDRVLSSDDRALDSPSLPHVDPGKTMGVSWRVFMPHDLPPGDWYLIFIVDPLNEWKDNSRSNNVLATVAPLHWEGPRLVITSTLSADTDDLEAAIARQYGSRFHLADWNDFYPVGGYTTTLAKSVGWLDGEMLWLSYGNTRVRGTSYYIARRGGLGSGQTLVASAGGGVINLTALRGVKARVLAIRR